MYVPAVRQNPSVAKVNGCAYNGGFKRRLQCRFQFHSKSFDNLVVLLKILLLIQ